MKIFSVSTECAHTVNTHVESWMQSCNSFRVDEDLDMDLVEAVAEHNGQPQWRERVQRAVLERIPDEARGGSP